MSDVGATPTAPGYLDPALGRVWTPYFHANRVSSRSRLTVVAQLDSVDADSPTLVNCTPGAYLAPDTGTASTPDAAGYNPTDFCIVAKIRKPILGLGATWIASQAATSTSNVGWRFGFNAGGGLTHDRSANGTSITSQTSTVTPAAHASVPVDEPLYVAFAWDEEAASYNYGGYWSADGRVWNGPLGGGTVPTAPPARFDSTAPVRIGGYASDPTGALLGIEWVELRTGTSPTAGTVIWRFDAADYPGSGTGYTDPRGKAWTLTAANAIAPARVAYQLFGDSTDAVRAAVGTRLQDISRPAFGPGIHRWAIEFTPGQSAALIYIDDGVAAVTLSGPANVNTISGDLILGGDPRLHGRIYSAQLEQISPPSILWRWDASEYPGGTYYTDPRGVTWNVDLGAIIPPSSPPPGGPALVAMPPWDRDILEEEPHRWEVRILNPDGKEWALDLWTGLDITDSFEGPYTTIEVNALEPALPKIQELTSDLLFFRNRQLLYRMRVVDSEDVLNRDTHVVSYTCIGYEKLLDRRILFEDRVLVDEDLDAAWALIAYTQAYETFNITRDPLSVGGTTRQRSLSAGDTIWEAINDFAEADDGFDWWVDQYLVWHGVKPRRGKNISDEWKWGAEIAEIGRQIPLEDYASVVMTTGAQNETRIPDGSGGETVYPPPAPQVVELASKPLGRWVISIPYSDVVTTGSLGEKAQFNLNDRGILRPTYKVTCEPGTWNPSMQLGDVFPMRVQSPPRLDIRVPVRIEELQITCSPDGAEVVQLSVRAETAEAAPDSVTLFADEVIPSGRTIPRRRLHSWDDVAAAMRDQDNRVGRLERQPGIGSGGSSGGGGGVTDGPKGDITVSGGGTDWQINAGTVGPTELAGNAVTSAKIADNAVANADLADMATARLKGRTSAGTGDPEDLTGTQATALLDVFTPTLKGLVPPPTTATGKVLSDNGTWITAAGGSDEVYVGTDDPIGTTPTIELWVDTDEPSFLTNDMRWFTAWGVVGVGTMGTTGVVAADAILATLTAATVAGRRYRMSFNIRALQMQGGADGSFNSQLYRDGVYTNLNSWLVVPANYHNHTQPWFFDATDSGPHTWTVQAKNLQGWAVYAYLDAPEGSHFVLEDVGPATAGPPAVFPQGAVVEATYTPTWTAVGGTPVLGTGGFIRGSYQRIGQWVTVSLHQAFGTGVNGANQYYRYSLPFPGDTTLEQVGQAKLYHAGTGTNWNGICLLAPNGTDAVAYFPVNDDSNNMQPFKGADATSAVGTGTPAIPGQYTVSNDGNFDLTIRYRIKDGS